MRIIAVHNANENIRISSSAGGAFSILCESVLSHGGTVFGVGFDEKWNPAHLKIESEQDLSLIRGAKYVYSHNFNLIVQSVVEEVKKGKRVLFSGTPCQIAVIEKQVGYATNLLLVEVICHGSPTKEIWERYLTEQLKKLGKIRDDIKKISFRDKIYGWKNYCFSISFKNGDIFRQSHDINLYNRAFIQNLTLRSSCFKCPFKYPDGSKADISLGDFWGIENVCPEIDNNLGTTIVIARTEKGESAISDIKYDIDSLNIETLATYNPAIAHPPIYNEKKQDFDEQLKNHKEVLDVFRKYAGKDFKSRIKDSLSPLYRKIRGIFNVII